MKVTYVGISPERCQGSLLEIDGDKYHHLVRVRRVRVGDRLHATLPDGRVLLAEITEITPEVLRARIEKESAAVGLSPCRMTLYQAVLKGDKMEWVVQKATELGITALVPLLTRRTIPRWSVAQASERAERWQRIAESAAEQCERSIPLLVEEPGRLAATLPHNSSLKLLLHERAGRPLADIVTQYPHTRDISLYIGPEGGWNPDEVELLLQAGAIPIHLGGRILRAETASLAAMTLAQYLWGDLGA
jgi:16S rRNA (uracil1498-N3)-methyltransferase